MTTTWRRKTPGEEGLQTGREGREWRGGQEIKRHDRGRTLVYQAIVTTPCDNSSKARHNRDVMMTRLDHNTKKTTGDCLSQ